MKNNIKVLEEAIELISPEGAWCQGVGARDKDGECVATLTNEACSFCITGSIYKVTDGDCSLILISELTSELPSERSLDNYRALTDWNDSPDRTQKEVVNLMTNTLKRLRSE